jgi:choline dehydrogenase
LTGPDPDDPVQIEADTLSHPEDLKAALACIEICREIGNSSALRAFTKREVMPGNLTGAALEDFIRDAAAPYYHQTCTAKMGRDSMSVVDAQLKVYGIQNLRVADGSIMPRVTRAAGFCVERSPTPHCFSRQVTHRNETPVNLMLGSVLFDFSHGDQR